MILAATILAAGPFEGVAEWATDNSVRLGITVAAIVAAALISTVVARRVARPIRDEVRRHKTRRTMAYLAQFAALAVIAVTWISQTNAQLWIGLASVGLAMALQNVILCLAGWLFVTLRRPYDIGDRIQADKLIGDVLDVRLFHTYLLEVGNWVDADQSTGRVVHMPNSVVFTQSVYNYTQGFPFIWNEVPVLLTFESDWRRAKAILQELASRQARDMSTRVAEFIGRMKEDYPIRYENLTPIVYTAVRDSGVLLTIRYLTEVRARRKTAMDLYEGLLSAFADEPNIALAYPTYRMYRGSDARGAGAGPAEAPGPMGGISSPPPS